MSLPDRDSSGACWDGPGCGAPDPYVQVRINGAVLGVSPAASDRFNATLNYRVDANITAGSTIRIDIFDEDLSADDGAFACVFDSVGAPLLRSRNLSCSGALGSLVARAIARIRHEVIRVWRKWLSRRSQRARVDREHMTKLLRRYPLPPPRLVHPGRTANP